MRTLLLLLVMVGLLASSLQAVAHVDAPLPASSQAGVDHAPGGDLPAGDDHSGAQKHCDLCGHGFGHLATAVPSTPAASVRGTVPVIALPLPPAVTRPDLQHRPPK